MKILYLSKRTAVLLLFLLIAPVLFAVIFSIMFPGLNCTAAPSQTGAWVLKGTDIFWSHQYKGDIPRPDGDVLDTSYTGGTMQFSQKDTSTVKFVDDQLICEGHWVGDSILSKRGENPVIEYDALLSITVSAPPTRIVPGDLVELNISGYRQSRIIKDAGIFKESYPYGDIHPKFEFEDKTGITMSYEFQKERKHDATFFISNNIPENSATYSWRAVEPTDSNRDLYLVVKYEVKPSDPMIFVREKYHYVWTSKAASALPTLPESSGPVKQIDDSGPKASAGEETTDVKTAAILGIAATVAAIAGAGAAAAGGTAGAAAGGTSGATGNVDSAGQKSAEEAARQKSGDFRMVLYKSFGDIIIHRRTNQYVMARIERKDEVTGLWELDSTRSNAISITISLVEGLELYPPPLNPAAPGKGHTIMLQNENPKVTEAVLSLKFSAPDRGYFRRNMKFKLLGESSIKLAANKVWFLEGDYKPFELECELVGYDPAVHNIYLDWDKDHVILEMAKNSRGDDVIKVTPAPGVFDNWDKKAFIYPYACSIAYEDKVNLRKTAKAEFTVNLCYEGIGLANSGPDKTTKIDELPEPMELFVYSEEESYRRAETMLRLALVVASWDDKKRILKYDTNAAKTLQLDYTVDTSSDQFRDDTAKNSAVRAFKDAALKTSQTEQIEGRFDYDKEMEPAFFATVTTDITESGLASFPILLTISLPGGRYPDLVLKGTFNPLCDWEKIVRWFFEFPAGTFAAGHMTVGNPDLYVEGLKFIENRVYSFKNVPFAPTTNQNHYEDGVIASTTHKRVRSVVLQESSMPTGIGDYTKAQSLVHELTHALEHKNMGSAWTMVAAEAGHERHTYFLQYASDAIYELALAERGANTADNVRGAIISMNRVYFNSFNTAEPRKLSWFGAEVPTQHRLFKTYIDKWTDIGAITGAGKVGEILSRTYFPGAMKNADKNFPATFEVQSGKLKGAKFLIGWVEGRLINFAVWHKHYQFEVKGPLRWTGGFTLRTKLEVIDKLALGGMDTGTAQRSRDTFIVTLTAPETLDYDNPEFITISGFSAAWQLESGDDTNSILAPDIHGGKMTTPLVKVENTDLKI